MVGNSELTPQASRNIGGLRSAMGCARGLGCGGQIQFRTATAKGLFVASLCLMLCAAALTSQAALQFDVFLGYDGIVPEASWFPIVCEVKNDGPSFTAMVEVTPGNYNQGQVRRLMVELPTGTLKRFVLPVFSTTRGYSSWDVRLLDERGKVRAEQPGLRPRKQVAAGTPVVGALTRTAGGTPTLRPILPQQAELQPASARLLTTIFPDNPLVLEGMDSLYLSSEKAAELRVPNQVEALYAWLNAGGHLIVGVEQISDINSTPWLQKLFPVELKDMQALPRHREFQEWLKGSTWATNITPVSSSSQNRYGNPRPNQRPNARQRAGMPSEQAPNIAPPILGDLDDDAAFEAASIQVATGTIRDGHVVVASADETPLIVTANRGRGRITAVLFSPEREPFRSWKNLPTFWAKLTEVPAQWYVSSDFMNQGGLSSDGIFGAMIDTRQVHKLPVEWLLLLLIVYLVVIGPLDQFWLKKIGRPMLTWITFPCYVVLFSLLIYFIGYRLRSGESEWNELHLVDVLANGERAELRGRTYSSVYAPSNQRYLLESQQKFATLRGEFVGLWAGGQSSEKATIMQIGDSFKAEIFVPVWTSQLFVSDWWQSAAMPMSVSVTAQGEGWQVKVENKTERKLSNLQIALQGNIATLGDIQANQSKTFTVAKDKWTGLKDYVFNYAQPFQEVVRSRQQAFGGSESGRITDLPNSTVAASFLSQMSQGENIMNNFIVPPGLDMSSAVEHGNAVLFAWAEDFAPVKPLYQFTPRRSHRNTMWRVAVPVL
jgi:hypothetical protein